MGACGTVNSKIGFRLCLRIDPPHQQAQQQRGASSPLLLRITYPLHESICHSEV